MVDERGKDRVIAVSSPARIVSLETYDVRFPTSLALDGSDAMHPEPDYSAAYVVLGTDADDGLEGHGLTFTLGPRHRDLRARRTSTRAVRGRPHGGGDPIRHAGVLADARRGRRAALARSGEGRRAPGGCCRGERGVGPVGQTRGEAALEAARRHEPRGARRLRRLQLHHRRPRPGAGRRAPVTAGPCPGGARGGVSRDRISRLHDVSGLARL